MKKRIWIISIAAVAIVSIFLINKQFFQNQVYNSHLNNVNNAAKKSVIAEKPVTSQKTISGDIPDSQVFIVYKTPYNFQLDVPEGWTQSSSNNSISFIKDFDGIRVSTESCKYPLTLSYINQYQIPALKNAEQAIKIEKVENVKLKNAQSIVVYYISNSKMNKIANKEVQLENRIYYIKHNNMLITIKLWAPLGSDNKDQWNRISNSINFI